MTTQIQESPDGITAFEVTVGRSKDYQSAQCTLRYEFSQPVSLTDMTVAYTEVEGYAEELATARVNQLAAEKQAAVQAAVEQQVRAVPAQHTQQTVSAPLPQPAAGGVEWKNVPSPNGRGNGVRFRPTSNLDTDSLKAMIAAAIQQSGADASLHVIYDERTGPRGLETTGKGYGFASVKPTEANPAYTHMLEPSKDGTAMYAQASFFVDFNEDGTVRVKPTDKYTKACQRVALERGTAPAAPAPAAPDLPF